MVFLIFTPLSVKVKLQGIILMLIEWGKNKTENSKKEVNGFYWGIRKYFVD